MCRTRTFEDIHGEKTSLQRGNLSFTTLNLPRLALESVIENKDNALNIFYSKLEDYMDLVEKQLIRRFEYQCTAKAKQMPLMTSSGVWMHGEELDSEDEVREILKHGTLAIGFIGLAETLIVLTGKHHGESKDSQKLGLEIIKFMNERCKLYTQRNQLNFAVLATPAEGLSGRFTALDRERFGIIKDITDKEFYTNSFHKINVA